MQCATQLSGHLWGVTCALFDEGCPKAHVGPLHVPVGAQGAVGARVELCHQFCPSARLIGFSLPSRGFGVGAASVGCPSPRERSPASRLPWAVMDEHRFLKSGSVVRVGTALPSSSPEPGNSSEAERSAGHMEEDVSARTQPLSESDAEPDVAVGVGPQGPRSCLSGLSMLRVAQSRQPEKGLSGSFLRWPASGLQHLLSQGAFAMSRIWAAREPDPRESTGGRGPARSGSPPGSAPDRRARTWALSPCWGPETAL